MSLSVEQCSNFENSICNKCGRMLPDVCKAQEDIEEKARLYDEFMASQALQGKADEQSGEVLESAGVSDVDPRSEPEASTQEVVKKTQVPLPKRLKK